MTFSAKTILFLTVMVDLIGFGIIIPLISLYGSHFGGTTFQLAVLSSVYSLMQFVFSPVWGKLSDRIGRRPILIMSSAGLAVSYLIFGLATNIYLLIVSRAFAGIFAANIATAQAYMADVTPPEKRTESMGLLGAAFGVGFVLGPPIGAFSSAYLGLHVPGLLASLLCFCNCLFAYYKLPESLKAERREAPARLTFIQALKKSGSLVAEKPVIIYLFLITFLTVFFFSGFEQTLALAVKVNLNVDTNEAVRKMGMIMMVMGLFGIFMQGYVLRKIKKNYTEITLLSVGLLIYGSATFGLSISGSFSEYIITCLLISAGSSLINPSVSGMLSRSTDESNQGLILGVSQGLSSLARVFGPFIGIHLFSMNSRAPFLLASFGSFMLFFLVRKFLCLPKLQENT